MWRNLGVGNVSPGFQNHWTASGWEPSHSGQVRGWWVLALDILSGSWLGKMWCHRRKEVLVHWKRELGAYENYPGFRTNIMNFRHFRASQDVYHICKSFRFFLLKLPFTLPFGFPRHRRKSIGFIHLAGWSEIGSLCLSAAWWHTVARRTVGWLMIGTVY